MLTTVFVWLSLPMRDPERRQVCDPGSCSVHLITPELRQWLMVAAGGSRARYSFLRLVQNEGLWFQSERREVRDSFQPYLMASGQRKEGAWRVLGVADDKGEGEEEKQHPSIKVGERWGKP